MAIDPQRGHVKKLNDKTIMAFYAAFDFSCMNYHTDMEFRTHMRRTHGVHLPPRPVKKMAQYIGPNAVRDSYKIMMTKSVINDL